jgi:hypothetical protein
MPPHGSWSRVADMHCEYEILDIQMPLLDF